MSKSKKQQLWAFWKYDLFPYVLGGEVESIECDGSVRVFGGLVLMTPILILPKKEGQKRMDEIKRITNEYRRESDKLKTTYKSQVEKIMQGQ